MGEIAEALNAKFNEIKALKRKNRELERGLKDLVSAVTQAIAALDGTMKGPSTEERGKRVAAICNGLEMAKDAARFGPLDIDFRTGKKRKPPAAKR